MLRFATAAGILFSFCLPADAQQPLTPGSSMIAAERVLQRSDTFDVLIFRNGDLVQTTRVVRVIDRVADADQALIRQTQVYHTPSGVTRDTTWIDARTLEPVRYFAEVYGETQRFVFHGLRIDGSVEPADSAARHVEVRADSPFFNAVAIDLLLESLTDPPPSFSVAAYNPPASTVNQLEFARTAQERVSLSAGGFIEAIRICLDGRSNFWIDARTGSLLAIGGGSGETMFWKLRNDVDRARMMKRAVCEAG